jgi:hypothetical protein
MCASRVRIIKDDDIAWTHLALFDGGTHRHRHRTQMHGHVIALRDQTTTTIKDGTGIIAALFDVWRKRRAAQADAHLLRDRGIKGTVDFEFDGIHEFSFQFSVFSFQFSVFSFQFSVFSFQIKSSVSCPSEIELQTVNS